MEVKLARDAGPVSGLVDEINADTRAYALADPQSVFVVYDKGSAIRDETEFRRDLHAANGMRVFVVKH